MCSSAAVSLCYQRRQWGGEKRGEKGRGEDGKKGGEEEKKRGEEERG